MKQSINFLFVIFLVVVSFLGGTFLSGILKPNVTESNSNQNYAIEGNLNVEKENVDINLLWEVWDLLEKEYISDDINNQELLYGAARGLVSGLDDRYTAFLNPEETKEYLDASKSEFEGIGTTLRQEGEFTLVESPIDGSPAEKAGLLPGDMILEVEGEDMQHTRHPKIGIWKGKVDKDRHELYKQIEELICLAPSQDYEQIIEKTKELIPEYIGNCNQINSK